MDGGMLSRMVGWTDDSVFYERGCTETNHGNPGHGLYTISCTASTVLGRRELYRGSVGQSNIWQSTKAMRKLRAGPCIIRPLVGLNMVKLAPLRADFSLRGRRVSAAYHVATPYFHGSNAGNQIVHVGLWKSPNTVALWES